MTIEQLEDIRLTCLEIRERAKQIKAAYDTRSSPVWDRIGSRSEPSDPTKAALAAIEAMTRKQAEAKEKLSEFENELSKIQDKEIKVIIRQRFIKNSEWEKIDKTLKRDKWYSARKLTAWLKSAKDPDLMPGYDWKQKKWKY